LRGYLNEGGLYAERIGAHLPGFPDTTWTSANPTTHGVAGAGINFYRTTFDLVKIQLPVARNITDNRYRTFLMGLICQSDYPSLRVIYPPTSGSKYISMVGKLENTSTTLGRCTLVQTATKLLISSRPQTLYVLPAGILRRRSANTLGLSLWSLDGSGARLAGLQLVSDGIFSTSIQFDDYDAFDYPDQERLRPAPVDVLPM